LKTLESALSPIAKVLVPLGAKGKNKGTLPPVFSRNVVTIVSLKTVTTRFLPVSHEGFSNETYVDKVDLLGTKRAEFIARKQKGIERRAHMSLFREMLEAKGLKWEQAFEDKFGRPCIIPGSLCVTCWNCSLFGALEAGKGGTFARVRYFDTWTFQSADDCVASATSEEGLGIGNTVSEDLAQARGADSYHLYEYVKAGSTFPVITVLESPTALDVAGIIMAIQRADVHGYGKYSANHGKFRTEFVAVAAGMPRFSVLDLLEAGDPSEVRAKIASHSLDFETDNVVIGHEKITALGNALPGLFDEYWSQL